MIKGHPVRYLVIPIHVLIKKRTVYFLASVLGIAIAENTDSTLESTKYSQILPLRAFGARLLYVSQLYYMYAVERSSCNCLEILPKFGVYEPL